MLASIGTYSGPIGSITIAHLQGAQLWTRFINARGGLNGHPVQLVVYDDGGDTARHRAQVQDAIEVKKVVAFLQNNEPVTGRGSVDYVTQKRVPVIGGTQGDPWYYESPMFFPQATFAPSVYYATLASAAQQAIPAGKTKLGSLICVEAEGCTAAERIWEAQAKSVGFDYVYKGRASLAQPDYTAECLAARNAGVQVIIVFLDPNSIYRLASACRRQGYNATLAAPTILITEAHSKDDNLQGMYAPSFVFPWFQRGTPATDEFQAALKSHGGGISPGPGQPVGWVSGKLLEKAAANLPEPPTSAAILDGLWSLQADTLGGLTAPLTYVREKPAPFTACWFNLTIRGPQVGDPRRVQAVLPGRGRRRVDRLASTASAHVNIGQLAVDDEFGTIREGVRRVCAKFDDAYWRQCDQDHEFPWDFYDAMAEGAGSASPSPRSTAAAGGHHRGVHRPRGDRGFGRGYERLQRHPPVDLRDEPRRQHG